MSIASPTRADRRGTEVAARTVSPDEAKALILDGRAPSGLRVDGSLDLSGNPSLAALPADLRVRRLTLNGCSALLRLPTGLHCYELQARSTGLRTLPADLRVEYRLDLRDCLALESLPADLRVGSLILRGCVSLSALPEGLEVYFLDIAGCGALTEWPARGAIRFGHLDASDCIGLRSLPTWLTAVAQLNLSGCAEITSLPDGLTIGSWLDIAGSGIAALPSAMGRVPLRWRGVAIDERIAFHPETIAVREVLDQPNAELRRVLMERVGYETFLSQAAAREIDHDHDPGGERRLLRVSLPGDEDLVCLAVSCPSTGRQYMLRVPPTTRSCRQAAAWIAGYDNPADYRPLAET